MIELANQEIFTAIKEEAADVFASDDGQRAYVFVSNLPIFLSEPQNQDLALNHPELAAEYDNLAARLSFVAIPALSTDETAALFKDKLLLGLREERVDLVAKIKAALLTIPSFESRDEARGKFRQAMKENQERLSSTPITIGVASANGTIGNWLKKYEQEVGAQIASPLQLNQFLTNDQDVKKLSEPDRQEVRRLISLYEYLKLSSQTPEGLEDPVLFDFDGAYKKLRAGEWEEMKLEGALKQIAEDVLRQYKQRHGITEPSTATNAKVQGQTETTLSLSFDFSPIINQSRAMLSETNGDIKQILNKLEAAVGARSVNQALAALLLLAQLRRLDDVLADDERFRALVAEDLKKAGQNAMLEGFGLNPTAPNFLARFLKIILQDKLGLSEADALSFIQKLIPVLALEGEKYSKIIIDDGRGGRKWNL